MGTELPILRGAGFQTCCIADFQVGLAALRPAGLETRDTADLEVCATLVRHLALPSFAKDWGTPFIFAPRGIS
jgi:hypothetical protein